MAKKKDTPITYTTKEICANFGITAPRLLQMRKGQTVKLKKKVNGKLVSKDYTFPPILIENKDWSWDGSEVLFYQSAFNKLAERNHFRRQYKKHRETFTNQIKPVKKSHEGLIRAQDLANKLEIKVQRIYSMRDISKKSSAIKLQVKKDWVYSEGKVMIMPEAASIIENYIKEERNPSKPSIPKSGKITVIFGDKAITVSGETANNVLKVIEKSKK